MVGDYSYKTRSKAVNFKKVDLNVMDAFNNIPSSISHKQLNKLFINAHKEFTSNKDIDNSFTKKEEVFDQSIESWKNSSKELLSFLSSNKKYIAEGKSPNQLMALGALEVHISMALQALKATEEND